MFFKRDVLPNTMVCSPEDTLDNGMLASGPHGFYVCSQTSGLIGASWLSYCLQRIHIHLNICSNMSISLIQKNLPNIWGQIYSWQKMTWLWVVSTHCNIQTMYPRSVLEIYITLLTHVTPTLLIKSLKN